MASLSTDANGRRRILFTADDDGPRKAIHLGRISQRTAEGILYRVERLIEAKLSGQALDADMAKWVGDLKPKLAGKLVRVGLIAKRQQRQSATLGPFIRAYIDGRADLKPATKIVRGQVIRDLTEFFGDSRDVRTVTPGEADDFKQYLVGRKLAPTTIHKRLQVVRSFFHALRRRKMIDENPFEGVKSAATGMRDKQRFVTREEIEQVLKECTDHHWRVIVALARYGGLRCPSEVLSLRWQDVNWAEQRIVVQSPKTEHHADKAARTIPLFPELRPHLEQSFDLAAEGTVYVVHERFRKAAMGPAGWMNANLRTTFEKIIKRAGLIPWPRLFHNLRASRETELVKEYPVQVVTSWLGNTPRIALKHYLMVRTEDFERAVAESSEKTAQKAAQRTHATCSNRPPVIIPAHEKTPDFQGFAGHCDESRKAKMAGTGFEPATSRL